MESRRKFYLLFMGALTDISAEELMMIILEVLYTRPSPHISSTNFLCSSYFIVISTNGNQPDTTDVQDLLVEDSGHYEENHMQLVPVGYFIDNGTDDSGNSQF